jgi:hypothetical protein
MGSAPSTHVAVGVPLPASVSEWEDAGPAAVARALRFLARHSRDGDLNDIAADLTSPTGGAQPAALARGAAACAAHGDRLAAAAASLREVRLLELTRLTCLPPHISLAPRGLAAALLRAFAAADAGGLGWLGPDAVERLVRPRFPDALDSVWLGLLPGVCDGAPSLHKAAPRTQLCYRIAAEEFALAVDVLCCMTPRQLLVFAFLAFTDPAVAAADGDAAAARRLRVGTGRNGSGSAVASASAGSADSAASVTASSPAVHAAIRLRHLLRPTVQPLLAEAAADLDGAGHLLPRRIAPASHTNAALVEALRRVKDATRVRLQGSPSTASTTSRRGLARGHVGTSTAAAAAATHSEVDGRRARLWSLYQRASAAAAGVKPPHPSAPPADGDELGDGYEDADSDGGDFGAAAPPADPRAADLILVEDWLALAAGSPYAFHGLFAFRDALAAATGGLARWEARREAYQACRSQAARLQSDPTSPLDRTLGDGSDGASVTGALVRVARWLSPAAAGALAL